MNDQFLIADYGLNDEMGKLLIAGYDLYDERGKLLIAGYDLNDEMGKLLIAGYDLYDERGKLLISLIFQFTSGDLTQNCNLYTHPSPCLLFHRVVKTMKIFKIYKF
ncbi:unnamed protein product [Adineta ricciae]|uniref:Uncharacterized protein n=1 Tax=Adineta ricciae TaxID=249248 RepID=A0A814R7V7_ADIRI|nr:unnamed protein product [Adineta ricciae]